MTRVRIAMEYLEEQFGGDTRYLAHQSFYHDERNLFLGTDEVLLSLSERGQLVDKPILAQGLRQIRYGSDGYAEEFFPTINGVEQRDFAVDPSINYGRLTMVRLGVKADTIADRYNAGECLADLVEDYGATDTEIVEAIRWHDRLAA